jgi:competence protein ComEC
LKIWGLLILGAIGPFLFNSALPVHLALVLLLAVCLLALLTPAIRVYCLAPAMFLFSTLAVNERLEQRRLIPEGRTQMTVTGIIASLPRAGQDMTGFYFRPDAGHSDLPAGIRVNWYHGNQSSSAPKAPLPAVQAGERWRLQLSLRPARSRVNFHGFDNERWYFANGIGALATVQDGDNRRTAIAPWHDINHWRASLRQRLDKLVGDMPGFRILPALAIADRRELFEADRKILASTGTGHLLAISGLHIGLAATMGFFIGRAFLLLLPLRLRIRFSIPVPWIMAWLFALGYSALSGFGISTQRALVMFSVLTIVTLSRRQVQPLQGWLVAMGLVLLSDPLAPLRAGFWLSFMAVGILFLLFVPRQGSIFRWRRILLAQAGITLVMAPVGMFWFQQASLPGLLANLVAIPLVSILIVPLVLLGLLFIGLPLPVSAWLLGAASHLSEALMTFLGFLAELQPEFLTFTRPPGLMVTLMAVCGALVLLLPRALPGRLAGMLLMLPLILPAVDRFEEDEVKIEIIDAGQGMAVLIRDQDDLVLYDTGPGNGRTGEEAWDIVDSDIYPMIMAGIRAERRDLGTLVVSHGDLDHSGGLRSLLSHFPDARVIASLGMDQNAVEKCVAGMNWRTRRLDFRVLHPSSGLPYMGNDSPCVISVTGAASSILLSGDISRVVERRLIGEGLKQHEMLTVPHHGSLSSSSGPFIETVKPSIALISAGVDNRFGFPRSDVLASYARAGIPTLSTSECGGIRLTPGGQGQIDIETARVQRDRIWRWPAGAHCP